MTQCVDKYRGRENVECKWGSFLTNTYGIYDYLDFFD